MREWTCRVAIRKYIFGNSDPMMRGISMMMHWGLTFSFGQIECIECILTITPGKTCAVRVQHVGAKIFVCTIHSWSTGGCFGEEKTYQLSVLNYNSVFATIITKSKRKCILHICESMSVYVVNIYVYVE